MAFGESRVEAADVSGMVVCLRGSGVSMKRQESGVEEEVWKVPRSGGKRVGQR